MKESVDACYCFYFNLIKKWLSEVNLSFDLFKEFFVQKIHEEYVFRDNPLPEEFQKHSNILLKFGNLLLHLSKNDRFISCFPDHCENIDDYIKITENIISKQLKEFCMDLNVQISIKR